MSDNTTAAKQNQPGKIEFTVVLSDDEQIEAARQKIAGFYADGVTLEAVGAPSNKSDGLYIVFRVVQ